MFVLCNFLFYIYMYIFDKIDLLAYYSKRNPQKIKMSILFLNIFTLLACTQSVNDVIPFIYQDLTRFNKIATQGAPQMAVDKEANSLSRVYSYYSKFNLCLFYV